MVQSDAAALSCYREIASLHGTQDMTFVQHISTGRLYVKKRTGLAGAAVYRYLRDHYICGLPEIVEVAEAAGQKPVTEAAKQRSMARVTEQRLMAEVMQQKPMTEITEQEPMAEVMQQKSVADITEEGSFDGTEPRYLIVIEEYVYGKSLRDLLDSGIRFSEQEAVEITEEVCGILHSLHMASPPIVHCDLHPSNIIRTTVGSLRLCSLAAARQELPLPHAHEKQSLRFGTATAQQGRQEQPGAAAFSGVQADIRSAGTLLCELLTGQPPEKGIPGGRAGRIIRKCINTGLSASYHDIQSLLKDLHDCFDSSAADRSITSGSRDSSLFTDGSRDPALSPLNYRRPTLNLRDLSSSKEHALFSAGSSGRPLRHHWMLPGYRNGNPLHYLIATLAYGGLLLLSLTFSPEKFTTAFQLWAARSVFLVCGLIILLFTGNYLEVWRFLRISRIRNSLLRLLVVLAIDAILFIASVFAFIFTGLAVGAYHFIGS